MSKTLIIAEKPSVARDIAKNLKASQKGDGFLFGNSYIISWAIGHLVSLVNPDELDEKYKKWSLDTLPILPKEIPLKILPKTKKQFIILKNLLHNEEVSQVICATDAGREGELIFRLIYTMAKSTKPVQRLWISSLTDEAILEGFKKLKNASEYDSLYQSALCRSQADWLVGMNASRAFTLVHNTLLSIGRVQTPTLGILVKRQGEIDAFIVEEYYTLTAFFNDYSGTWINNEKDKVSKIPTKEEGNTITKEIKGKKSVVLSASIQEKKELPPQLYDLTSLQRDANRLLGFSAQKTLKIAQSLYETKKAITYPRTDSRYLSKDLIPQLYKTFSFLPPSYEAFISFLLGKNQKLSLSKRIIDDQKVTDHHAIIPTPKRTDLSKLSTEEEKVFDLIVKRFIAVFYPPYEYLSQEIITSVEKHLFLSRGTAITRLGWKELYPPKTKKSEKEKSSTLPVIEKGHESTVTKTSLKQEQTKPPSPHTEASLLSSMENAGKEIEDEVLKEQMKGSGLGTPATRASIIERLISVGYVTRKGKSLIPSDKGISLIQVVPPALSSPMITGEWELGLQQIVTREEDPLVFMDKIRNYSSFLVEEAKKSSHSDVVFETEYPGKKRSGKSSSVKNFPSLLCPVCKKGHVTENQKAFSCSRWKEGCHFTLWKNAFIKNGGPLLNSHIVTLLFEQPKVAGSTGTLFFENNQLVFQKKSGENLFSVPLEYLKK